MCKMLICVLFLVSVVTSPALTRVAEPISSSFKTPTPTPKPGNCILPSYPDHGTYEVANPPSARPGQSFENFVLTVSCQRGYGLMEPDGSTDENGKPWKTVYCLDGVMYQNMPECVLFCRVDPDPSVRFMCQVPGTNGSKICEHYVGPETIVKPVCNTPNYYSSESLRYMKCIGGSWDYIARCNAGLPKNRTNIAIQINDKLEIDIGDFFNDNSNKITVNLGSSSATNNNNNVYNLTNNNILNIYINNDRYVNGITSATVNLMDLFHASGSNKNKNEISLIVGSSAANNNNNNKYNLTNNNVLNIHINNYRHGNEVATSTVNPIKFVNGNGSNKNNNEVSVNVGSSGANNNNYKKYNLAHDNFLNIYINNKGYSVEKLSTRTDYQ